MASAAGAGVRKSARIAAAAAAATAASVAHDAAIRAGGKRKTPAKGRRAAAVAQPGPKRRRATRDLTQKEEDAKRYAEEAKRYADDARALVLTAWVDTQLLDASDDTPDTVEALRAAILALPSRPLRDEVKACPARLAFPVNVAETLAFPLDPDPVQCHAIVSTLGNSFHRPPPVPWKYAPYASIPIDLAAARELSLLLRLFVASGGNLNVPTIRAYRTETTYSCDDDPALIAQVRAAYDTPSVTSTTGAELVDHPTSLAALILGGRRLGFNWAVYATPERVDVIVHTAVDLAFGTLFAGGISTTHGNPDFRPLHTRLMHVAGEAGIFFGARGAPQCANFQLLACPFSWKGDRNCAWMSWRFAEFEHHDHSPYMFPEHQYWAFAVNQRRKAYRRNLIQQLTLLLPPLCAIVTDYSFAVPVPLLSDST